MHQTVEAIPLRAERLEQAGDLRIVGDIARKDRDEPNSEAISRTRASKRSFW
jgi:hypothetical protein